MLGISIYPEKGEKQEILNYLDLAAKYGFKRVFTCLLSVKEDKETIKKDFIEINKHAVDLGMKVTLDVSPSVFDELGISYDDLSFFKELYATSIRLDLGFNGQVEANLTYNEHDLDIEINISQDIHYVDLIMDYVPRRGKLIASSNFYPQKDTGLGVKYFTQAMERFKGYNINTSAFINSNAAKLGPWPHMDGICSIEDHRYLDCVTQIKHMYAIGLVDDIMFGAMYASEEELKAISEVDPDIIEFRVKVSSDITDYQRAILFDEPHFNRGDINENFIRSTQSRLKYTNPIDVIKNKEVIKGDVLICNKNMGNYNGELQLSRVNSAKNTDKNVVATIIEEERFLIDYVKPWQKFKFVEVK